MDWPFFALNCRSTLPLIEPATHIPSSDVDTHAPSTGDPSA